jgi:hypothetical protein
MAHAEGHQFFGEVRFDAYRRLGLENASKAIDDLSPVPQPPQPPQPAPV